MADNSRAVNRVFTRKVICDLIENGRSDVFDYVVKRYIDDPSSKNHGQLISEIYAHLNKQQRNEYFYMNTLLNKLLCGIHNVNLNHSSIFKLLRKKEYERIVSGYFGVAPQAEPVFHFRAFLEKFEEIPILEAQRLAFQEMKKRNKITVEEFQEIQPELKAVIYFSGLTQKMPALGQLLETQYRR